MENFLKTALYTCIFDKEKRMLTFIEHQLYAKPFWTVISFEPHRTPVKQGFFLSPFYKWESWVSEVLIKVFRGQQAMHSGSYSEGPSSKVLSFLCHSAPHRALPFHHGGQLWQGSFLTTNTWILFPYNFRSWRWSSLSHDRTRTP